MGLWTKGPWFVSGVRFRMNGGEWHSINRYDEALKRDENIACVGYDPRTGAGHADARLIAAAPDLAEALAELEESLTVHTDEFRHGDITPEQFIEVAEKVAKFARAALKKAKGEA